MNTTKEVPNVFIVILTAVFVFLRASGSLAADVTFSCPTEWKKAGTVTLVCELSMESLQKCTYKEINTTFFEIERNTIKTTSCAISTTMYDECGPIGSATRAGCHCTKTSTHYRFVYVIVNLTAEKYNGDWGCSKSCFDDNGNNPLEVEMSDGCLGVEVDEGSGGNPGGGSGHGSMISVQGISIARTIAAVVLAVGVGRHSSLPLP